MPLATSLRTCIKVNIYVGILCTYIHTFDRVFLWEIFLIGRGRYDVCNILQTPRSAEKRLRRTYRHDQLIFKINIVKIVII